MRALAAGLDALPGLEVQWPVDTNICYMHLASHVDAASLEEGLAQRGVRTLGGGGALRVVTHHQVTAEDVPKIIEAFKESLPQLVPA